MVIFSIGLLTLKKWAIQGFISLFWLAGIAWLWVVWYISCQLYSDPVSWWIAIAGISVLIYVFLAVGILFLSNTKVRALIHGKEAAAESTQEILDQL